MTSETTRRQFLYQAALAGTCAATRPFHAFAQDGHGSKRPNFLFLLTDDQRWDMMGCAGNPIIQTPEMDALAREGVRFSNAFVTTSICAASRASIFTGLHERTHQYTFGTPPLRNELVDMSYPKLMRDAGYRTGFVGKFGVGVEKGARERMFDWFKPMSRNPYFKKQAEGTEEHLTDLIGEAAAGFLGACKPDQPFCLSVSFNAPHAEDSDKRQYFWPKAVDHLYRDVRMPVPKTADPAFFEALPQFLKDSMNRARWHWRFETPEMAQDMTKGYYRMISGIDAVIGRLRQQLERLGVADNTVIVLIGDNGYFLGERGFAGKWLMYEHSIRVPLIVFDPRAPQHLRGLAPEQMALNIDTPATMLDLAGIPLPAKMQGESLVPLLRGQSPPWRTDFFCEHLFENATIPKFEGVRTREWKYIRYFEQEPVYEELYHFADDFDEEHNLIDDPRHRHMLALLRRRCDELRDRYGGPFVSRKKQAKPAVKEGAAAFAKGVKGNAAVFDGKTFMKLGETPALTKDGSFTWSFWTNIDPRADKRGVVLGNRKRGSGDALQFMKVTPETVQCFNGQGNSVRMPHKIPLGKWVHVAVVKDGPRLRCCVDGNEACAGAVDFEVPSLPLYVGGDPKAGEMAACQVDEVRTFDLALSPAEIASLARLEAIPHGNVGYWGLDGK